MKTAFIIHGSYGHPEENWFPWLKEQLEKDGWKVYVPKFPTPENQSLQTWFEVWKGYEQYIGEETIFIGHSTGPVFLLHVLEKLNITVQASFLVAIGLKSIGIPKFDSITKSFFKDNFNWERIRRNCKRFFIYYSESDPYVPSEHSLDLAKNLHMDATHIPNAGHFNEKAGYTQFPKLLEDIRAL